MLSLFTDFKDEWCLRLKKVKYKSHNLEHCIRATKKDTLLFKFIVVNQFVNDFNLKLFEWMFLLGTNKFY